MLRHKESFTAIGTRWQIETPEALPPELLSALKKRIDTYDQTYSRFRSDSLLRQLATTAGTYTFPSDSKELLKLYRTLYDRTDGQFTPLIGSMLERAGYDADYSFKPTDQIALPDWDSVMYWEGSVVTTTRPITLDVGAAGKGQLIDHISALLEQHGIHDFVVDASGDLRHKGYSENIVGLEQPNDTSKIIGAVSVQNTSLCASSSNRRRWGSDMHHIFNPHSMKPTTKVIATWVIAPSTMIADGIATALFFTSPEKLVDAFDFQYVRMHDDGSIDSSSNFSGELYV